MKRYSFYSPYELDTIAYEDSEGTLVDADVAQELYNMLEEISAWCSFKPWDENLKGMKKDIEGILAKADGEDQ